MNFVRRISFDNVVAIVVPFSAACVLGEAATRTNIHDAQTPKECRYPPLTGIITEAHVRELESKNMVVINNVLSASELKGANQSAQHLSAKMDTSNHQNDADIRQDHILSIRESDALDHGDDMTHCIKLLRGVPYILNRLGYTTSDPSIVPRQCQLSRYLPDGSVYVRHLDRCNSTLGEMGLLGWLRAKDYRHRVVTAILYLNSPKWDSGGELRCYGDDEEFRDVNPSGGTLILFDSSKVEHQVLPSSNDRYALTCWFNGTMSSPDKI